MSLSATCRAVLFTRIGIWAAHNLGAKPDAEVLFTDRRIVQAMTKLREEERAAGQPPNTVYGSEDIYLNYTPFKGVMAGYSERCNQLFILEAAWKAPRLDRNS